MQKKNLTNPTTTTATNKKRQQSYWIETADYSFLLGEGENLLDALLTTGHALDYQCRSGYCGSCRVNCLSGTVDYAEMPLAHLQQQEILPCCCQVKSDLRLALARVQLDEEDEEDEVDEAQK